MTHPRVIRAAAQRKAQNGRRGLMRKAPDIKAPRAVENRYRAALLAYVEDLAKEVRETLIPALPRLIDQRNAIRADAWDEDLSRLLDGVTVFGRRRAQWAIRDLSGYADSVNTWNRSQFNRAIRAVIGVDIFGGTDGEALQVAARSWARENAALITNITEKTMTEVEGIAQRAVRAGANPRDVARDIQERLQVSESRARLIARDQIAKLNGQLTQTRNEALGIDKYIWSTSEDERVRESHRVMNGKLCRWDNPGVYSDDGGATWQSRASIGGYVGHPGQDYQCFPGSTQINAMPGLSKMYRRWYSGELCEIVFSDGVVVSATPNHPILTDSGIKPINLIRQGDHVVRHVHEAIDAIELNGKRLVPTFEQAFDALLDMGFRASVSTGLGGQFHGDGADGEVEVIELDRLLIREGDVLARQKMAKLGFTEADVMVCHASLTGLGNRDLSRIAFQRACAGGVGGLDLMFSLIGRHLSPFDLFCFALGSGGDAVCDQYPSDDVSGCVEGFGNRVLAFSSTIHFNNIISGKRGPYGRLEMPDRLFASSLDVLAQYIRINTEGLTDSGKGHPGPVHLDSVVDCRVTDFSGHVYNLETDTGYYYANTVAASNCRCTSSPFMDDILAEIGA